MSVCAMAVNDLRILLLALTGAYFLYLLAERLLASNRRKRLEHVVHINGTRGKSAVTRLIAAGLQAGGVKTCAKTTGTVPMLLTVSGEEHKIRRLGPANIREQLWALHAAARQKARVLAIECMAVDPALQRLTQRQMLRADIGVITNVRPDHPQEMGGTLEAVCDALSGTIPEGGRLFTAERALFDRLTQNARAHHAAILQCLPAPEEEAAFKKIDFPENVALALAVCVALGVDRETALDGMRTLYRRDPYALSYHALPGGALFVNAMAANDTASTGAVLAEALGREDAGSRRLTLVLNNRADRAARTGQMIRWAGEVQPYTVFLMGAAGPWAARRLRAMGLKRVFCIAAARLDLRVFGENDLVFAAGNIAGEGILLMRRVKEEGSLLVR